MTIFYISIETGNQKVYIVLRYWNAECIDVDDDFGV